MKMTERDNCILPHIPEEVCGITIAAVWDVLANQSYSVPLSKSLRDSRHCEGREYDNKIIIRTRGGSGGIDLQNGKSYELTPHTLFITDLSNIKTYYADSRRWSFWWFDICCGIDLKIPHGEVLNCPIDEGEYDRVETIELTLQSRKPTAVQLATSNFIAWLYACWDRCSQHHPESIQEQAVNSVVELMYQRLKGDLNVKEMADAVGMSVPQLRNAFRQTAETTPKSYYEKLRLRTAKNRLQLGAFSVAEVAEQVGYCDQFHFSKVFKKEFDLPPSHI